MDNKLDIRKGPPGNEQRIFLEGRLDASWAGHLDDYLNGLVREGSDHMILNMAGVQYLSSAGIRILVNQYKKIKQIGGVFQLEELSASVAEVLKMVGMIGILTEGSTASAPVAKEAAQFLDVHGYRFDNEVLSDDRMTLHLEGDPSQVLTSGFTASDSKKIRFKPDCYGLGLGAIGEGFDDCRNRYGEFLALGDALVYKPSDGSKVPDYTVKNGQMEPEIQALYSILAEGNFANRVSFNPLDISGSITLEDLADALSQTAGQEQFVFLLIAESNGLVGVNLSTPPVGGNHLFEFPDIRENVNFTTEPAYSRMLTVSFGVYTRQPAGQWLDFLRPVKPGSSSYIHAHAAVFPFQSLPKKETSAGKLIMHLFESSIVEDVMHLIHDSREIAGLGDSTFKQGIAWIGKLS